MNPQALSPSDLAIAEAAFSSVAEEMGESLTRSAFSPNIKERRDHSCGVFSSDGFLIAQAAHIPVHLGAMPMTVRTILDMAPFEKGDIIALNDPYKGGNHLPDITTVAPIFYGERLIGFVATRAHHADIGGMAPGSMPVATELYQEGLIIPPIRLVDAGNISQAAWSIILRNSRSPHEREGDLRAQLAATSLGIERVQSLVDRFSPEGVEIRFEAMLLHGERVIREVISKIPEGVYEAEDFLEISEGGKIKLSLEVKGDSLSFDFTGTDPESQTTSLNAVAQVTKSACYYAVRSLAPLDAPTNEGCYRPVHIALPRKSLVNASDPRAVSAGNVEVSQRITDVALKALSKALPDLIPAASSGTMNNITIGGYDSRRNRSYAYYETLAGGAGGGPRQAGRSGVHTHMTNTLNTPVEAIPLAYPFSIERYELRTGSGGRGKNPGGEGLVREYLFSEPATVTIISERRKLQPWGLAGGEDGASGVNRLIRANQEEYELAARETVQVDAGDRIVIETPGGGGFGPIFVN